MIQHKPQNVNINVMPSTLQPDPRLVVAEIKPIPDPTALTTLHIERESSILKELVFARFERVKELLQAATELESEKFKGIQVQFAERDVRIDAALQAAKEAVNKAESATAKQLDQLQQYITSGQKAIDSKIDDLKSRLVRIESGSEATATTSGIGRQNNQWAVSLAIGSVICAVEVALHFLK